MPSYKVKQSSLLLMDEKEINIDYLKENKPTYRIIERYSNKTHKMLLQKNDRTRLEIIGGVEND